MSEMGEAPSVEGSAGGPLIRLYANVKSGIWHLFVIQSDRACLIASGDKYTRYPSNIGRGA
jgi:hypothetical protein